MLVYTAPARDIPAIIHDRVPLAVMRKIDELSDAALATADVQATPPGTKQRLDAVRTYVVRNWPEVGCRQITAWFGARVRQLRTSLELPSIEPSLLGL